MVQFSKFQLARTSELIGFYREDWNFDLPIRIHGYGTDDGDGLGGPPYHPEFERWLGPICFCGRKPTMDAKGNILEKGCPSDRIPRKSRFYQSDTRLRTTKAFRKLRKVAPREFDVLYLICAHKSSFEGVLKSMNDRAIRLGKPTYTPPDILMLIVAGVDFVENVW